MTRLEDWGPSFGVDESSPTPPLNTAAHRPSTDTERGELMDALARDVAAMRDRRTR